jgi:hypothetical protein
VAATFAWLGSAQTFGAITIAGPLAGNHVASLVIPPDGDTVTLTPDPVTHVAGASAAMQAQLAAAFPAWTFTFAVGGLAGTLNIDQYKATSSGAHNGGGLLEATYTRAAGDPTIANLHWIQLVDTNKPLGGTTTPYIDPRPNDDTLPFYWTLAEDGQAANGNKTANTYHFFDNSNRTCTAHPETINWAGELLLASWDNNDPGAVTVYDGVKWGWTLHCVPEPNSTTTLMLLLTVGIATVVRRRRYELKA